MALQSVTIVGKVKYPKSGYQKLFASYPSNYGVSVAECRGSNIKDFELISVGDVVDAVTYNGQSGPMFEMV